MMQVQLQINTKANKRLKQAAESMPLCDLPVCRKTSRKIKACDDRDRDRDREKNEQTRRAIALLAAVSFSRSVGFFTPHH